MTARPVSDLFRSHSVLFIMFAGHARFLVLRSRRVDGRRTLTQFLNTCTICFLMEVYRLHHARVIFYNRLLSAGFMGSVSRSLAFAGFLVIVYSAG